MHSQLLNKKHDYYAAIAKSCPQNESVSAWVCCNLEREQKPHETLFKLNRRASRISLLYLVLQQVTLQLRHGDFPFRHQAPKLTGIVHAIWEEAQKQPRGHVFGCIGDLRMESYSTAQSAAPMIHIRHET